ncbi:MAG: class IV adenylate cyclase [Candidatus Woesearchaeota archaeon]
MKTEFEVKILEIDVENISEKLKKLGAKKIAERNMKRYVYDIIPKKKDSWVRLRFDGIKTTLTIKEIHTDKIDGTKEIEIIVDDFDKTNLLLNKLGYKHKGYQENKRISYKLNDVEIEIDSWPKIPTYLEIEAKSIDEVKKTVKQLGFKMSQTTSINTTDVYNKYGIDIDSIRELRFDD